MEQQASRVLSLIAYLRGFFGEDAFATSRADGMWVKTLRETPESAGYMAWMAAVETHSRVIHRIVLGVCDDAHELAEVYGIDTQRVGDLRGVCLHLQRMSSAARRVCVRLKIYSSVPLCIEGFRAEDGRWDVGSFEEESIGGVTVYRRNRYGQADGGTRSRDAVRRPDGGGTVRCTCLIHSSDGDMIQCGACRSWLHAACAGFFSGRDRRIPRPYACLYCSGGFGTGQRNASIYRRALAIVYNEDFSAAEYLRDRLGVTDHFSRILMRRLRGDGFVAVSGRGHAAVRSDATREKVKEHFNGKRAGFCTASGEIELDTAS